MITILTLVIIILAAAMLATINPVSTIVVLISVFILSSIYLISLSSNFVALSYIIIYVGAIAILLLFVVMMMNIKYIEASYEGSTSNLWLAGLITSALALELSPIFNEKWHGIPLYTSGETCWNTILVPSSDALAIGNNLYSNNSIWLIIFSMLLLLAMMGPIILIHDSKNSNNKTK